MKITIELADLDFDKKSKELVKETLRLKNEAELDTAMRKLAKAAILEYLNMLVERGMANRADEAKQDRLFFLIQHYYENRIPSEAEISGIFQLTNSQSKTLLRNAKSRYRTKIDSQIDSSVRAVVERAKQNKDTSMWDMVIESDIIREELNFIVTHRGPTLAAIRKKSGSAGQYEAGEDTYDLLRKVLGIGTNG